MDHKSDRIERLKTEGTLHPNPEKVKADILTQSSFFDAHDLVQMKYEMLRSVDIEQKTISEAAKQFGLSRVAYYRAHEQYQAAGLPGLLPNKRGPKHPHKFSPEVRSFIDNQLTADNSQVDWMTLCKQIKNKFGIHVHPGSIRRTIRCKKRGK